MFLLNELQISINKNYKENAFYIGEQHYTYLDFAKIISKIRKSIHEKISSTEKIIGIIGNDDVETYASIIALWLEGKAYVPLSPDAPLDRNKNILDQAGISTILDSSANSLYPEYRIIRSKFLDSVNTINLIPIEVDENELAYILFTSGTTGQPKGVPITRSNLNYFIDSFKNLNINLNSSDRCLQMFEFTFDLSVVCYLVPLLYGSCIYTIPKNKIKYGYIFELMDEHRLTFTYLVPSLVQFLRPYFNEILVPEMKYCLFAGEALPIDVVEEWSNCVPNAKIMNTYGPTENTIICTAYTYKRNEENKVHNGILSIGKSMKHNDTIIIDESNAILPEMKTGQLCLAGNLLTRGYWNNEEKNQEAFFTMLYNNKPTRYYKTGDLCYRDKDGDILYIGRTDNQVKIQGFRIELSEIEFHAKLFLNKKNAVALALNDAAGNAELGLIIESDAFNPSDLNNYLKSKIPPYMIPKKIEFIEQFPLNSNGKTDRKKLKQILFDHASK